MARWLQTMLQLLAFVIGFEYNVAALELPYEVLDSIMQLSDIDQDFKDLTRVNVSDDRGPTRPIYRLDLDPDYVAYYEIDIGKNFLVLSSGPKTGDFREVENGPDPRPTDVILQQAQDNGQRCEKFYRLSPMGLIICKNDNGTVVAASYNWTADVAEIDDWRQLDQMVEQSLNEFKSQWRERAAQRGSKLDWATTDVVSKGKGMKKNETDEEALSPGSIVKLALGKRFKSVHVYITNHGNSRMRSSSRTAWEQKLCKVLVDVCKLDGSNKVNPSAIKETPNYLWYLKLEVHGNRTFVGNTLQWREIGFVVKISGPKNEVIKKHFAISLRSKRFRRSPGVGYTEFGSIPFESEFPDYYQHKLADGCYSGCSPVAWAQVFGYYDRVASKVYYSSFSPWIYGDTNTVAPKTLTSAVKRFVEDIRLQVETFCTSNKEGSTFWKKMCLIKPWFQRRQGSKGKVISYIKNSRKRRGASGSTNIVYAGSSWIESKAVWWLKERGYPVAIGFRMASGGGHTTVATQYKKTSTVYRHCVRIWTKTVCSWRRSYKYEFFLHFGWYSHSKYNKFYPVTPTDAHVAFISNYSQTSFIWTHWG